MQKAHKELYKWAFDGGISFSVPAQEKLLYEALSKNPFLKIWVVCGYYDLATPFFGAEYTFDHLFLNEENKGQVSFTYYPCGHMFYLHKPSLEQFRADAQKWFSGTE